MKNALDLGDRLVLATHNAGKLREFRELLGPLGITVLSAADCGLPEPEETETTFSGNAALKAEAAMKATGLVALADDSGVTVEALGGDPGVYSARWAGEPRDFGVAMTKVLDLLAEKGATSDAERAAAFVAVLALARPDRETVFFEGLCEGHITDAPRGTEGFGYDPIFIPREGDGRTFGEMSAEDKHGGDRPLSHRARAVALFKAALDGK
ncbi:RdgB/HAM1 family non-canonical purine NTP pyrophosphatase [Acuticoccus sp. M5D2P5]|uniref:RdgB/HAM1 family non-canonical purine NTP pyrophosphatase n=1 Tax=Acuticoccus kalidii TaxID=2910977 RepID=UPI001F424426|nr:RdgB/HAM1 family non-canonical purine NTP pyrophosphatase [Acuticoccus kalidii]MCF3933957.1 RdgB/HAM1 family non-canonical purine NTP pyrophosphatase [Acuticoccus kalidii]